jgi:hypothetical protein
VFSVAKTNTGLVEYAKAQLGKPYWYGTFGQMTTAALHGAKKAQYPKYYNQASYKVDFTKQYGQRAHDCIGLIKGYLWSDTPTAAPKYNAAQDVDANKALKICTQSGKINTIPEIPGIAVFMKNHVGVYIGGGYVIEARGHDYGVVKTPLKGRGWTNWGKLPWIEYGAKPTATEPNDYTSRTFKNTSGKTLNIYADSTLKTKTGSLFAGSSCVCIDEIDGVAVVRYMATATNAYKVGFTDYIKGVQG